MLILIWVVVCIIFYLVQKVLGNSGHALELFSLFTALALFLIAFGIFLVLVYPLFAFYPNKKYLGLHLP